MGPVQLSCACCKCDGRKPEGPVAQMATHPLGWQMDQQGVAAGDQNLCCPALACGPVHTGLLCGAVPIHPGNAIPCCAGSSARRAARTPAFPLLHLLFFVHLPPYPPFCLCNPLPLFLSPLPSFPPFLLPFLPSSHTLGPVLGVGLYLWFMLFMGIKAFLFQGKE